MKNIFFVNPTAGQGKGINDLVDKINSISESLYADTEIYITKSVGDGENQARKMAEALNGQEARFYSCGGDGTNSEIINGIIGYDNVSVGCIPIGTGNDTVRNFKDGGNFSDIESQLLGSKKRIDLIKYCGIINGTYQEKYCVNMFNIGFDCNVVELAGRLKLKPMISGSTAYLMAVAGMFIEKKGINLKLIEGEKTIVDGQVLLCAICNGSYCGGGIYSSPQAVMNDGYFDLNIIKNVSRVQFIKLFPKYQKGTHLSLPNIEKTISIKKCKSLKLVPNEKNFFLCADGEINLAEEVEFTIAPNAVNFIVPRK